MKALNWVGVILFVIGIIELIAISIYPLYTEIKESTLLLGVKIGIALLIIGAVIVIVQILVERYREVKEIKEEIPEEDLRP